MEKRNRSEGWSHAKNTGHKNEALIKPLLEDEEYQTNFLMRLGKADHTIKDITGQNIHETKVRSILGDTTTSKTDIKVILDDDTVLKISLKKSLGGQVYLLSVDHFISGFEKRYVQIPAEVKRAIELFWGTANDIDGIIDQYGINKKYEKRKHRVCSNTINSFDINLYNILLYWFNENIYELFDFCFSKGLAADEDEWADILWYKNNLGENNVDELFFISDLAKYYSNSETNSAIYGHVNGGTTIQLPFGFVQWHSPRNRIPGKMQFHHTYSKIVLTNLALK